jgi:hypothetical protein
VSDKQLAVINDAKELVRQSTDIASLCRNIVVASAVSIQGRKYVKVEGWQSIATAHGCVASARDVQRLEGGIRATGEIRRMMDGQLIATAEGFVGEDEPTWFGGGPKNLPKRPEYAIRAMAQTRAISRACRSCFAHVVVLMDAGLETTPAEEVPHGGFNDDYSTPKTEKSKDADTAPVPMVHTDEEKRLGNIAKLSAFLAECRPEGIAHAMFEEIYALEANKYLNLPNPKNSLAGMGLEDVRDVFRNRSAIMEKALEACKP